MRCSSRRVWMSGAKFGNGPLSADPTKCENDEIPLKHSARIPHWKNSVQSRSHGFSHPEQLSILYFTLTNAGILIVHSSVGGARPLPIIVITPSLDTSSIVKKTNAFCRFPHATQGHANMVDADREYALCAL